jgi:hypothetical protein
VHQNSGYLLVEWALRARDLERRNLRMVRGVRQMEGFGVVHLSLLNVPREYGREWEVGNGAESEVEARDGERVIENWAIMATPYCHNLKLHQKVFAAVVLLLQLSFE